MTEFSGQSVALPKVGFYDAYKEWRNRARRYRPESVVRAAITILSQPVPDKKADLERLPWVVLLIVKWVCQDGGANDRAGTDIKIEDFIALRQMLWNFSERVNLGPRDSLPFRLFMRQLINPQIGFQREFSAGFVREAALLDKQPSNHPLRRLFEEKSGITLQCFLDLSFATFAAMQNGKQHFDLGWFLHLREQYSVAAIDKFADAISRTYPQLVEFCRNLPDADKKVASELHEFPVLTRYPFLRIGNVLHCWHPMIFYRGMENFVHSVLSEEGQGYIDRFSKLFEGHVIAQAKMLDVPFYDEAELTELVPQGEKVPDGLLSFPNCNVFIESKAGLFDGSVMAAGHSTMFSHKTKALRTAVQQGWSASFGLRAERRAPSQVIQARQDFLLIVTNKELNASRGTTLASMYPEGTLEPPSQAHLKYLPLSNIYVASIDDFERLIAGASEGKLFIPSFLGECVKSDQIPEKAAHFVGQHLTSQRVPKGYSVGPAKFI